MKRVKNVTSKPRLQEMIKQRGLIQKDFAELAGLPQPVISRFDKQESHKDEHVAAILAVLGCTYDELFEITVEYEESPE